MIACLLHLDVGGLQGPHLVGELPPLRSCTVCCRCVQQGGGLDLQVVLRHIAIPTARQARHRLPTAAPAAAATPRCCPTDPPPIAGLCNATATLLGRLQHHGVQAGLLLQCAAVADAGLSLAALQAAADRTATPLLITQPSQLAVSLR